MAHIDPLHPLFSNILEEVAASKSLGFEDLRFRLKDVYGAPLSSATLYRRLNELIEEQVLLRYKRKLSLNLVWVSHILRFSDLIRESYAVSPALVPLPQREGEHRYYEGGSLASLDPIWNHIHVELGMRCGERVWYGYNAHPWYPLGMPETERRLQESFVANGYRYHLLYGGETFLDRHGQGLFEVEGFCTAFGRPPGFHPHNYAVWAGKNHVIECVLPEALSEGFATFFSEVRRLKDFNRAGFAKLFRKKALCRLRVTKSRREAERLRGLLKPYFKD